MKLVLCIFMIMSSSAFALSFRFKLFNTVILIKNYGTYNAYSDGTYAKSCNDYKNPVGIYKYNQLGDGIYKINANGSTLMNVYCDMTNNGGGWTLIASAAQVNVGFPTNYNISSLASAKTINFNNYNTGVFGTGIATSQKMVAINGIIDGTYSYSSGAGWFISDIGSKTLRANWSRYSSMSVWMMTSFPYSQMTTYGLLPLNHGSICNSSNNVSTYMHTIADGTGGVHQGVQLSQETCDDNYNWKDNFNWQVYSK